MKLSRIIFVPSLDGRRIQFTYVLPEKESESGGDALTTANHMHKVKVPATANEMPLWLPCLECGLLVWIRNNFNIEWVP